MTGDHECAVVSLSLRDRQREALRTELTRAAYSLFIEHGYDNVSVDDIAAAAGLSRRTVFRHVAAKEDLLLGPIRQGGAAIARVLEDQPPTTSPADALTTAIVARAGEFEETASRHWRAALLTAPDLLDKITMVSPTDRDRITMLIAARMDCGESEFPAGLLVHLAFAAGDYSFRDWVRQPGSSQRALRDCVADALREVVRPSWGRRGRRPQSVMR